MNQVKKQIILLLSIVFITTAVSAQLHYKLNGEVKNITEPSKIFLQYRDGDNRVNDSVIIKNGKFSFQGELTRPVKATLIIYPLEDETPMTYEKFVALDKQNLYLENSSVSVKGKSLKTADIKGGKTQKEFQTLNDRMAPLEKEMSDYQDELKKYKSEKNENGEADILTKLRGVRAKMTKVEEDFIPEFSDSYVSYDLVSSEGIIIEPKKFEPLFNHLSERLKMTKGGKEMARRLDVAKRTAIGQTAMDFTQKDLKGNPVTLSSLRGKYILLDFWASWCGPCRAENPNVLNAYNKFKDKNFDVLAVSLDESREDWVKAIEEDGMPWIHVSDLLGFENAAAVQYGIVAIPQNFLIDPSGKIVATNLRGDKLDQTLTKIISD